MGKWWTKSENDAKRKSYKCKLCIEVCSQRYKLMKHMRTEHTDDKPYECDKCSEKFGNNDDLKIHMRTPMW